MSGVIDAGRARVQRPDEGKECSRAPVVWKRRNRLRLRRSCEAGERHDFTWRQTIRLRKAVGDRADLFQTGERTADFATTLRFPDGFLGRMARLRHHYGTSAWLRIKPGFVAKPWLSSPCVGFLFRCYSDPASCGMP
jgi:hypothetical protein